MKRRIIISFLAGAITLGLSTFTACKKKEVNPVTTVGTDSNPESETQQVAADHSQADKAFSDVFDATDDAIKNNGLNKTGGYYSLLSDCATVSLDAGTTVDTTNYPKNLTITFGNGTSTDSCLGKDGRWRKGKIHVKIENKRYRDKGAKITVTLDNYYVDGYHIEGTKAITNNGTFTNSTGTYIEYAVNVSGGKITSSGGASATWASTRTRQTYVDKTGKVLFHLISGSANGINFHGTAYTVDITTPLKVVPGCRWIEAGVINIIPQNKATRTVDFGNSGCDRLANLIINGHSYQFEMR
jgi:hypothetical protein